LYSIDFICTLIQPSAATCVPHEKNQSLKSISGMPITNSFYASQSQLPKQLKHRKEPIKSTQYRIAHNKK